MFEGLRIKFIKSHYKLKNRYYVFWIYVVPALFSGIIIHYQG